jgi:hypothetical protein
MLTEIPQTDTVPVVFFVFDAETGEPVDLTGATVEVRVQQAGKPQQKLENTTVLTPLTGGRVQWIPDGSLEVGPYHYQVFAARPGEDLSGPTGGFGTFVITPVIPAIQP